MQTLKETVLDHKHMVETLKEDIDYLRTLTNADGTKKFDETFLKFIQKQHLQ